MARNIRKGNIHKVREFEIFSDAIQVNSLTAKMIYKYIDILNLQARKRLLPPIELKVIDEEIKPSNLWDNVYRRDYTISIISPKVNIGEYRPLKLVNMIKQFQRYNNFNFFEAVQPVDKYGAVIKEFMPYFQTNNAKKTKKIDTVDLLKVSKIIIDTYGYCRKSDNQVEGFNWLRTTGEKAFDILNTEPSNNFNDSCKKYLGQIDKEIDSMLVWNKICSPIQYKYKQLANNPVCDFSDISKVVSLIVIYRKLKKDERINYFLHQE